MLLILHKSCSMQYWNIIPSISFLTNVYSTLLLTMGTLSGNQMLTLSQSLADLHFGKKGKKQKWHLIRKSIIIRRVSDIKEMVLQNGSTFHLQGSTRLQLRVYFCVLNKSINWAMCIVLKVGLFVEVVSWVTSPS